MEELKNIIAVGINHLQEVIRSFSFPDAKLHQLSNKLDETIQLLQDSVPHKIVHHHHVTKMIWIAAGLFIALTLVSAGWFVMANKLDDYMANDTKYRYLKLDTGHSMLQQQLYRADSMFNVKANLRDSVIHVEEQYHYNFELLQKANRMNAEAENLKVEAKKLKKQTSKT